MKHILGRREIVVLPFLCEYLSHRPSRLQGPHKWWVGHEEHPLDNLSIVGDQLHEQPVLRQDHTIICLRLWLVEAYIYYLNVEDGALIQNYRCDVYYLRQQHPIFFEFHDNDLKKLQPETRGMRKEHGQEWVFHDKDVSLQLPPEYVADLKEVSHAHVNVPWGNLVPLERV